MKREKIAVIGDGAMGTVCALLLAENGHEVSIWSAFPEQAAEVAAKRENVFFLPGHPLPENIAVTGRDEAAFAGAAIVLSAVPTQFIRPVWTRLKKHFTSELPVFSIAKGIENGTRLHEGPHLGASDIGQERHFFKFETGQKHKAGRLRHGFDEQHTRYQR